MKKPFEQFSKFISSLVGGDSTPKKHAVTTTIGTVDPIEIDVKQPRRQPAGPQIPLAFLGAAKNVIIADPSTDSSNIDLSSYRSNGSVYSVIRSLCQVSPDLSQAVATRINSAIPDGFTAVAYSLNGDINVPATQLLYSMLARMNFMSPDYTVFNQTQSLRELSESLLMDEIRYGSMMTELVLGKSRFPLYIKRFPSSKLFWHELDGGIFPLAKINGIEFDMNIPTMFYLSAFQDGETGYSSSQIEAAIQPVLWEEEFKGDLRRAVRNVILPRLKIAINTPAWRQSIPADILQDEAKTRDYMTATITSLENKLNTMNPEDAMVYFDILETSYMTHGNISSDKDISVLSDILSSNVASGAKTLPAILGNSTTQGAGSSESMIFMKGVEAAQNRLSTLYSRILTLAIRLFGLDVYVKFQYDNVNLRPKDELEAFKAMKQSRVLQLLSLGFITDEEAALALTGHLPPTGFTPLCGTGFNNADPAATGNPYSNTSVVAGGISDTTIGKATKSPAPTGVKSKNQGAQTDNVQ